MAAQVLAVGSVALDTIQTPSGRREDLLGGSSVYFSLSARHFAKVNLVGIVGDDFPPSYLKTLEDVGVNLDGLKVRRGRKTFRWSGAYEGNMSSANTLSVELNVLAEFDPALPRPFRSIGFAMLGNCSPQIQANVFSQLSDPRFVLLDSMNFWIQKDPGAVLAMAKRTGVLCLNYEETLMLSGQPVLSRAVDALLRQGVKTLIVKKAEHGSLVAAEGFWFHVPAFPTREVIDPTGAGDAYAGGILGYLAAHGISPQSLKKALVYGSVMGSFAVEGFGPQRLLEADWTAVERRAADLMHMMEW